MEVSDVLMKNVVVNTSSRREWSLLHHTENLTKNSPFFRLRIAYGFKTFKEYIEKFSVRTLHLSIFIYFPTLEFKKNQEILREQVEL